MIYLLSLAWILWKEPQKCALKMCEDSDVKAVKVLLMSDKWRYADVVNQDQPVCESLNDRMLTVNGIYGSRRKVENYDSKPRMRSVWSKVTITSPSGVLSSFQKIVVCRALVILVHCRPRIGLIETVNIQIWRKIHYDALLNGLFKNCAYESAYNLEI